MYRCCQKFSMFILLFVLTLCGVLQVFSQATSGTILGQVTDPQSGAIPNATVNAKNDNTGLTQNAETNDNGEYVLLNLPPGSYTITITKDGFTKAVSSKKILQIDQKLRIDIQLAVGSVNETVNVSAEPPLLQTQSTETSQVVDTKKIADLPLLGRNFLDLTKLSTGVVTGGGGNQLNIAVNGQREFANSVVVDGIEVTGNRNNDTGLSVSVDAVQEFKIQTSAYMPEYGRASGASVLIQMKSGANAIHGSVYEFFRPSETAARRYFSPVRGDLNQHNFGGTIGGPIAKDKLFFFVSYENVRSHDSFSVIDTVPPIGQIKFLPNGDVDLSGLVDPLTGTQIPIFDPLFFNANYYSQQFAGNIIPANRVSAAGRAIFQKLFPTPTQGSLTANSYGNFVSTQAYKYTAQKIEPKFDYNISDKDRLNITYHYTPFNYDQADKFAGKIPIDGGGSLDSGYTGKSVAQSLSIAETHIFSSNLVNEFRFGYSRFKLNEDDLIADANAASSLGFGNINVSNFPSTGGLPYIYIDDYSTGGSTYKPLAFLDSNFQFKDNISFQVGSHSLKGGIDFRNINVTPTFSLLPTGYFYTDGRYQYPPYGPVTSDPNYGFTNYNGAFPLGGSSIADILLGYPTYTLIGLQLTDPRTKSTERGFYLQDSWQARRNLVLNFGFRYEYQSPFVEKDDNLSNFDPVTKTIQLAGRGSNSRSLINPDKDNIMPRVGIAYTFRDKTVLRAGYGIFYSPENDARSDVLTKNYPFATRQDYTNGFDYNTYTFLLPYRLDTGIPRVTTVPIPSGASSINALTIPNAANQAYYFVDPNFETGYSQLFNMTLQHQLLSDFTVEAAYVGSVSHKLPYAVGDINRRINGNKLISNDLGKIEAQFSQGNANYHSMQLKADKRFSRGYGFYGAYTWGKCIDNGPAPFNLGRNSQAPQNPLNLKAERALCSTDVKHSFVATFNYELPFGKGRKFLSDTNSVVNAIIGGWQFNGIFNARTGLPFNVTINAADGTALRPNLVGNPFIENPTMDKWFNTAAFSNTGVTATNPGSAGRNILRGPGYSNLDFSAFKRFYLDKIREGMNFEIRFELFNVTNTPHFNNPNAVFGQGNFGKVTQTIGNPRIIQFAGKFIF